MQIQAAWLQSLFPQSPLWESREPSWCSQKREGRKGRVTSLLKMLLLKLLGQISDLVTFSPSSIAPVVPVPVLLSPE